MFLLSLILPIGQWLGSKAKLFVKGQAQIDYLSIKKWRKQYEKVIWFHCASLGEFEQGRPVLELFRKENPKYGIMLTFFSPSGYEIRKNYENADFISYLPIDQAAHARHFVQSVQPDLVVFVKYEFWPNIINEIKKTGAHLIGISVIFRPGQIFFKPWGSFFRKTLQKFDYLFLQNQASAHLLDEINYQNYEVVGDTRFDRVVATANQAITITNIEKFLTSSFGKSMVIGSAWPEDMQVLKPFILAHPEMKFIIAPHEIHSDQIQQWKADVSAILYSEFDGYNDENVLIVDSIGLLSKLYKYADYAFVGGGFKTGLHNILEPAVFGIPVFFGDQKYKKFQEALDLIDLGVAYPVNHNDLEQVIEKVNSGLVKEKADLYVKQNRGATEKILTYLKEKANP